MSNIWRIIRTDTRRIFSSVVAFIIIMGLCVVPVLYAWFNIFSNWDPYGLDSTSRIRVAVATKDKGTSVLGLKMNVGNQLVETLHTNKQIGWVFADSEEEALWRVYSGDCYAALIVPEDFSKDIVSFMTLQFEHPELQYYENGKKNAIAPKITGKAKNAVQETVNTVFLQTIVGYAAEVVEVLEENGWDLGPDDDDMVETAAQQDASPLQEGGEAGNAGIGHDQRRNRITESGGEPPGGSGKGHVPAGDLIDVPLDGGQDEGGPGTGRIDASRLHSPTGRLDDDRIEEGPPVCGPTLPVHQ